MKNYTLIRTFTNKEEAKAITDILNKAGIDFKIQNIDVNLIPYLQPSTNYQYGLFIKQDDVPLLEKTIEENITEFEIAEHPLQEMTDDELLDVLKKQDEWDIENILIAKRILLKRGLKITDNDIANYNKQRITELKKPIKGKTLTLVIGFLFPVLGILNIRSVGFLGSIIYLFSYGIGANYLLDFKKLPNGEKVKVYDKKTRITGLLIILWAVLVTIGTIIFIDKINN